MSPTHAVVAALLLVHVLQASAQAPARIALFWANGAYTACESAFKDGMREHGLIEGKQYVLDTRDAQGHYDRFPALTQELLKASPSVIIGSTIAAIRAAQQATRTVPILFAGVNDPVGSGLVGNLARPEGNTTGLSNQSEELLAKYVEIMRELLPRLKRVAILFNPSNGSHPKMLEKLRTTAAEFEIATQPFAVRSPADLDAVLGAIAKYRPDALLPIRDAMLNSENKRVVAFALEQRLPTFAGAGSLVRAGSLMSYAAPQLAICRRSAYYVKRILEGAKPAELPVEQPTTFELVINMKTAKSLGITVPRSLLVRADEVIQ